MSGGPVVRVTSGPGGELSRGQLSGYRPANVLDKFGHNRSVLVIKLTLSNMWQSSCIVVTLLVIFDSFVEHVANDYANFAQIIPA